MLKFYTTYRLESPLVNYPALLGATPVAGKGWLFWIYRGGQADPIFRLPIAKLKSLPGGSVQAVVDAGENPFTVTFHPVTVDYMKKHPDDYALTPETAALLDSPGMMQLVFQTDLPEDYIAANAPTTGAANEAKAGSVKLVDGVFYEVQADGTLKPSDWFP